MKRQIVAFNHGKLITSLETAVIPEGSRKKLLQGLTEELLRYGYTINNDALLYLSEEDANEIYQDLIPHLIGLYHSGSQFQCLYKNFPDDVLKKSEEELKGTQLAIYADPSSIDEFINNQTSWYNDPSVQTKLSSGILKTLGKITSIEFLEIPISIMKSGMAVSNDTMDELKWFLETYPEVKTPEVIPFKEIMCTVMGYRMYIPKDINDILRYAMSLMGSSVGLETVHKLKYMNAWSHKKESNPEWRSLGTLHRSNRKRVLKMMNILLGSKDFELSIADAKRFYGHWVLLSERIHSGDYKDTYPLAARFFQCLQTKDVSKDIKTWNSKIQKLYDTGVDIIEITKQISTRPGELVRRFDSLIRRASKQGKSEEVMDVFLETSGMKNKTLLELMNYYERRNSGSPRIITIKGGTKKKVIPGIEKMPKELIELIRDILIRKVMINIKDSVVKKDMTEKTVFIDPRIKQIPVPLDMRNSISAIPSGTRVPIKGDIVRFFVHWKQEPGKQEDLDLHAKIMDENCKTIEAVGWNQNQKVAAVCHSGDILNRPGDCAEYIDVDFTKINKEKQKYIAILVSNYKGRGFDTLPCWLGYSIVPRVHSGEKWIPVNVEYNVPVTNKSSQLAAMVIDVEKKEMILINSDLGGIPTGTYDSFESITKYYTADLKFTSFDILEQYYISRGANVITVLPDDTEGIEKVELEDIIKDYTKVLEIIG